MLYIFPINLKLRLNLGLNLKFKLSATYPGTAPHHTTTNDKFIVNVSALFYHPCDSTNSSDEFIALTIDYIKAPLRRGMTDWTRLKSFYGPLCLVPHSEIVPPQ